ncbi:MAG: hypothetical protein DMF68_10450 [Acidobacteria bacterium]|nr:MAG: hypothetical protein DMF68_10450 [Acidobacteriota bacterium]
MSNYKPWENAPILTVLAASQQGGSRGAQLWGIQINNQLNSIYQVSPGGNWSGWMGTPWNQSKPVIDIAASQQGANDGRVELWALDQKQQLWTCWQTAPGGNWTSWVGPNWNKAPLLQGIAACSQGGTRGAQLWGIGQDSNLYTTYQTSAGNGWSSWSPWNPQLQCIDLAAANQNDGRVQLWAIDAWRQLWTVWQTSPGGNWTSAWSGPNWANAPKLQTIAASQQGGSRGAQLWGITEDYHLVSIYQVSPGGNWSQWSGNDWEGAPTVVHIAACLQNDGRVQLWAITTDNILITNYQTSPGGNWSGWQ